MLTHYNDTDQQVRAERDYNALGIGSHFTVTTQVIKFEACYVVVAMVEHYGHLTVSD